MEPNTLQTAKLHSVLDGDTIVVSINNRHEMLRILGIDAPELTSPDPNMRERAVKSFEFLRELIRGKLLHLGVDGPNKDKYGRLLRHVFIIDNGILLDSEPLIINVGEEMIKRGHAKPTTKEYPCRFSNHYHQVYFSQYTKKGKLRVYRPRWQNAIS